MKAAEPKDLMDVLARLEDTRHQPGVEAQRRFRRFTVRGEATLEPMQGPAMQDPLTVLLRDISRGGAGFLTDRFIEPCSTWRLPNRQGVHLPHDSYALKENTWCKSAAIDVCSSKARTPPWPMLAPMACNSSKPNGVSSK